MSEEKTLDSGAGIKILCFVIFRFLANIKNLFRIYHRYHTSNGDALCVYYMMMHPKHIVETSLNMQSRKKNKREAKHKTVSKKDCIINRLFDIIVTGS